MRNLRPVVIASCIGITAMLGSLGVNAETKTLSAYRPATEISSGQKSITLTEGRIRKSDGRRPFSMVGKLRSAVASPMKTSAEQTMTIVGSVLDEDNPGIYSYSLKDNTFSPMFLGEEMIINGGGMGVGDTYYGINITGDGAGMYWCEVRQLDLKSLTSLGTGYCYFQDTAIDMDYDPVTGRAFGCFQYNNYGDAYVWAQWNTKTFSRAAIKTMYDPFLAVAADASGQFWAIDVSGNLLKVKKETGDTELVGSTGVDVAPTPQSATFDRHLGIMYWAAELMDGTTALYEVNTNNGRASLVNVFPGNEILLGIYVPDPVAAFGAPASVSGLSLDFPGGSLSGKVAFKMPALTYGGNPLSGSLDYTISANGTEVKTGSANAGSDVNVDVQLPAGYVHVEVVASNSEGDSPVVDARIFAGPDAPVAVSNLNATLEGDNKIKLTWDAPTATINGGFMDPALLRYTILRVTDNKVVADKISATTFTDEVDIDNMQAWQYKVTAYANDIEGESIESSPVLAGNVVNVPWHDDCTTGLNWPTYTVINANNDNYTWVYSASRGCIMVDYDWNNPKDDWLITPPLNLNNERTYKLEFMTHSKWALPESFEVKIGKDKTVEAMTKHIMEETTITSDNHDNPDIERVHEFYFTVDDNAPHYIGFHATSEPQMARLELYYVKITEAGLAGAPAAIDDLSVSPGEKGALEAAVSFTTPSKAINGHAISSLEKVEIYVNGELAKTVASPKVGVKLNETVPTKQGNNTIMVKAYNELGQGLEAKADVYTGVVVPGDLTNLVAKLVDGKINISWTAPEKGRDGGYIDPDKLSYMIMRSDRTILAYNTEGASFVDDLSSFEVNGQGIVSYIVYPRNEAGTGDGVYSNGIVIGDAFHTLPYVETFPNAYTFNSPWGIISTTETNWYMTTKNSLTPDYNGDNGMAVFQAHGPSESSMLYAGRFNLNKTAHPVLSLMYYNSGECGNVVELMATTDYGNFVSVAKADLSDPSIPVGWNRLKADLSDYINAPVMSFGIKGTSGTENWNRHLFIDQVMLYDDLDYNLELMEFDAPAAISFGHEGTFAGYITNKGKKEAENYTIDLYCNGEKVAATEGAALKPGGSTTFVLKHSPAFENAPSSKYKVVVNYPQDQNVANNTSEEKTVLVMVNDYPTVTNLNGKRNESDHVDLSWSAPQPGTTPAVTLESFEDYTPFIIDGIGEWTLVDVDGGQATLGISYGGKPIEYLNYTAPMAYQIFNGEKAGLGKSVCGDIMMAHTGDQFLASFQDYDGANDDWLISPELSGDEQTVTFWVKTPIPNYGFEKFEVYYSTTDKEISSFIKVEGLKEEAFKDWEEVAVNLPAGAKYFAIRHISDSMLLMFGVDDIKFVKKGAEREDLVIDSYNIYRDDVKVATVPAGTTTWTDTEAAGEKHSYAVTVNYKQGESGYSNILSLDSTGLDTVDAGLPAAYGVKGAINVVNAADKFVSIVTADGKTYYTGMLDSNNVNYEAAAGIYVVTIAGNSHKVIVK